MYKFLETVVCFQSHQQFQPRFSCSLCPSGHHQTSEEVYQIVAQHVNPSPVTGTTEDPDQRHQMTDVVEMHPQAEVPVKIPEAKTRKG